MLKHIICISLVFFLSHVLNAQNIAIDGYIKNLLENPVPGLSVTLNTPTAETTTTDENGYFVLTTQNFPTRNGDFKKQENNLFVFPNPAKQNATLIVPHTKGELAVFNSNGQLLGKTDTKNNNSLTAHNPGKIVVVKFLDSNGNSESAKIQIEGDKITFLVQPNNQTKSAVQDTFSYKLAIAGNVSGNVIDTTIKIAGFSRNETSYTHDFTINTKQTFLKIINIALGKVLETPYSLDSAGFINKRLEPANVSIYNANNTFNKTLQLNGQGEEIIELPQKGVYFVAIKENQMFYSRIARLICDDDVNKKITSIISKEMSERNYRETEQAYQINWDDIHGELLPPIGTYRAPPMTQGWQGNLLKKGGLNHVIIKDLVMDAKTGTYHEEETPQILIDSVLSIRAEVDPYLNNFYANGNTVIVSSGNDIPSGRKTLFSYYDNDDYSTGTFAKFVEDGVIVGANIGLNKDYWGDGTNNTRGAALQEHLSVKAPYELQIADKPSILEAGGNDNHITDDTKRALETYQIERELLRNQEALTNNPSLEASGVYPIGIEELALKESANHPLTQEIVMNNGVQNIIDTLNTYTTKSATLKSGPVPQGKYAEFTTHNIDGSSNTVYITKDNFAEAKITGINKKEIKDFFEK